MENKSWTVTYRNRDNGQRITAAVFAVDQQQAREKAKADGREAWEVESIEPNEETLARILVAEFAKAAGRTLRVSTLWEDDDGRRECHAQRAQPPRRLLHLRYLRNG